MENTIQVSIDKSHITTIGEKLYGESLELIRELVSNSYDADATRVWIEIAENQIKVRDDGSGMDQAGLREYFNIGSQNKKFSNISTIYRRMKIGQFGIGKFAVLSACNSFRLFTQKDGYAAEVIFDKENWQNSDHWSLPISQVQNNPLLGNGTMLTLEKLKKHFTLPEVERFIRERLPMNAPHFEIYLNHKKIEPVYVPGKHFPVAIQTGYGMIQGEMLIPNFRQNIQSNQTGIEITVNGIVIKRETFDMEMEPAFTNFKLMGRVSADFVLITSDRSRFITDTPEYQCFWVAMRREIKKIVRLLNDQNQKKEKTKADETLKETMFRLGKAIRKNPIFSPKVMSPTGEIDETAENFNSMAPEAASDEQYPLDALKINLDTLRDRDQFDQNIEKFHENYNKDRLDEAKKVKIKNLTGKMMVARKIKIGGLGIVCNLDNFGKDEKPIFIEGGIIYINQDHTLYQKQTEKGKDHLSFYLAYLLSQQIALMMGKDNPHEAFAIQNKLLSDCF